MHPELELLITLIKTGYYAREQEIADQISKIKALNERIIASNVNSSEKENLINPGPALILAVNDENNNLVYDLCRGGVNPDYLSPESLRESPWLSGPGERWMLDKTPLMIATIKGDLDIMKILLMCRANPGIKTAHYQQTALIFAAQMGNLKAVTCLVNTRRSEIGHRFANISDGILSHRTALDAARENRHVAVADFIDRSPQMKEHRIRKDTTLVKAQAHYVSQAINSPNSFFNKLTGDLAVSLGAKIAAFSTTAEVLPMETLEDIAAQQLQNVKPSQ